MNRKIQNKIIRYVEENRDFAVATIVHASKGSPRKSGTKMIVFPDGTIEFTIGGGKLEQMTIENSIKAIEKGENTKIKIEFQNNKSGMICGGEAEIFIEVYKSAGLVVIFGGGHIAVALAKILDVLGLAYRVYDDRKKFADAKRFPNAQTTEVIDYNLTGQIKLSNNSYCVIVTHGHKGDKEVLKALLESKVSYIGMIGSKVKVKTVLKKLEEENINIKDDRICAPVGLDIGGESPEEIAVSIIAEILKVKYKRSGKSLKDS
jgi:xanthine dehydrogenase accessory factor